MRSQSTVILVEQRFTRSEIELNAGPIKRNGMPPWVIKDISQCNRHVRFTPKADIVCDSLNVRFVPISMVNHQAFWRSSG